MDKEWLIGEKIILVKPQTYMNLSGISGKIRIRKTGGAGTHNGMKSIVQELGNKDFYRIKIGVRKTRRRARFSRICFE